jgi:hypothetical protein
MPTKLTLDELPTGHLPKYLKILLVGAAGSGKTTLAAGIPGATHFLDIDGKLDHMAAELHTRYPSPKHRITYQQFDTRIEGISRASIVAMPDQRKPELGLNIRMRPHLYEDVLDVLNDLSDMGDRGEPLPFDTLVLDSFSHLMQHLKVTVRRLQKHAIVTQHDWGVVLENCHIFLNHIRSLPCNIIVTVHERPQYDSGGEHITKILPDIQGRFGDQIASFFQEVWWLEPRERAGKMEISVLAHSTGLRDARSSLIRPMRIPANMANILAGKYLTEESSVEPLIQKSK